MGVVYLARHPQLGFEVAIKVLLAGPSAKPAQLERFRRELEALAQLQHPGLVDVLEAGEREGRPWFAMRRVPGTNLEHRIQTQGALSPAEVVDLGTQLCQAVGHAHGRGILHRDLKPENVLCGPNGRYAVTDFGLTKSLEDSAQSLSKTGTIQGTPGYWAPEQASGKGKEASPRTDVYGVGAILYAALTGEPPIKGESMFELVVATCERPPQPPSKLVSVPAPLEAVVLKCLAKSPEDRFESLADLESELQSVLGRMSQEGAPAWAWALLAVGVAAALGLPALLRRDSEPPPVSSSVQVQESSRPAATPTLGDTSPESPELDELDELRRAAEAGQAEAMLSLGKIYFHGELVPRDLEAALRWYRRAAQVGNTRAMVALAIHHLSVKEVKPAAAWLRRAAEGGDPEGMGKLALIYMSYPGFDPAEGLRWLRLGAEAGDAEAMLNLGTFYSKGQGVTKDLVRAAAWYRKAAQAGNVDGMARLAAAYSNGEGVARDSSEALRWARKAANLGNPQGMLYVGQSYARGLGVDRNYSEALRWYRLAAEEGEIVGYFCTGKLYLKGQGVPKDPVEAARLFQISAAKGHPESFRELANLYVTGRGVERDVPAGLNLYRQAVAKGSSNARYDMGVITYNGTLVERDLHYARRLLDTADGIYPAIFAFLCQAELEGLEPARRRLRTRAATGRPSDWQQKLLGFLFGEVSEEALLGAAREGVREEDRRARFCEAYFYAAALCALAEDLDGASARAKLCLRNPVEGYKEISCSEALLRRIKDPRGPR